MVSLVSCKAGCVGQGSCSLSAGPRHTWGVAAVGGAGAELQHPQAPQNGESRAPSLVLAPTAMCLEGTLRLQESRLETAPPQREDGCQMTETGRANDRVAETGLFSWSGAELMRSVESLNFLCFHAHPPTWALGGVHLGGLSCVDGVANRHRTRRPVEVDLDLCSLLPAPCVSTGEFVVGLRWSLKSPVRGVTRF